MEAPHIFFDARPEVRPALDFVGDKAFVTIPMDIEVPVKKKVKGEEVVVETKRRRRLITIISDGKAIQTDEDSFVSLGLRLTGTVSVPQRRWSEKGIKAFLEGTKKNCSFGEVFNQIKMLYSNYIDFGDSRIYDYISLWVIGTYFFPLCKAFPMVFFGGTKESGKTKALTLTQLLAFNAISSGNVSTASLFRVIEGSRATFLLDESEKLSSPERAAEFRNVLNSGYKPGNPVFRVEKTAKDQFVVVSFEAYSPKMIANISGIEDVLESRTVPFTMLRTTNKEIADREIDPDIANFSIIKDNLYFLVMKEWKRVKGCYEKTTSVEGISARNWEIWRPILALARVVGEDLKNNLYEEMIKFGIVKAREKLVEDVLESRDTTLLEVLLEVVKTEDYYSVKEVKGKLIDKLEENPKWVTAEWLGRAMKRLGFTEKRRMGKGVEYKLVPEVVRDRAVRLGMPTSQDFQVRF